MMYVMCLFQRLSQYSDEVGASKSDVAQVRIQFKFKKKKNYFNLFNEKYTYMYFYDLNYH